ncbi:MAG: diguanylate cyclase [Proteobacteria bacterium]|nr:diguanylate cyclase [Pseudomonadota bacterium]
MPELEKVTERGVEVPPITGSIAVSFLRVIFGCYFIVTLVVTCVQLFAQYQEAEQRVDQEISAMQLTFGRGIADAMWRFQDDVLGGILAGAVQVPVVVGVVVEDGSAQRVRAVGTIKLGDGRIVQVNATGAEQPMEKKTHLFDRIFSKQFPIVYVDGGGKSRIIGRWTVFSNQRLIFKQVEYSFYLTLINSIVKTAALWFIFLYTIRRWLGRPLTHLSAFVKNLQLDTVGERVFELKTQGRHELHFLADSLNAMLAKLKRSVAEKKDLVRSLQNKQDELLELNQSLESRVLERTSELKDVSAFNEVILQSTSAPVAVYAASGRCVLANEAFATLVGATKEVLLTQNFHQIVSWRESGLLGDALAALKLQTPLHREVKMVTSFGKHLWVEYHIIPTYLKGEDHLLLQLVDLTERKRQEDELRQIAFHDALTKLPNRRLLHDRLERAVRSSKRLKNYGAVLFLDLNKFKQLNDTHGHDVGDALLVEVAHRLQNSVRDCDTVARLGGDEFVVLLEDLGEDLTNAAERAELVADKLRAALSAEYVLGEIHHFGSASIGIKVMGGVDKDDPDQIIKDADAAMYLAKKNMGSGVAFGVR